VPERHRAPTAKARSRPWGEPAVRSTRSEKCRQLLSPAHWAYPIRNGYSGNASPIDPTPRGGGRIRIRGRKKKARPCSGLVEPTSGDFGLTRGEVRVLYIGKSNDEQKRFLVTHAIVCGRTPAVAGTGGRRRSATPSSAGTWDYLRGEKKPRIQADLEHVKSGELEHSRPARRRQRDRGLCADGD